MHTLKVKLGECSLFLYSAENEKQMHTYLEQMVTEIIIFWTNYPFKWQIVIFGLANTTNDYFSVYRLSGQNANHPLPGWHIKLK